jgi:ABC-type branched-subunit amino acid transport system substrate-binding protein
MFIGQLRLPDLRASGARCFPARVGAHIFRFAPLLREGVLVRRAVYKHFVPTGRGKWLDNPAKKEVRPLYYRGHTEKDLNKVTDMNTRKLKLIILLLSIVAGVLSLTQYSAATSTVLPSGLIQDSQGKEEKQLPSPLTPQEKRGKAFYLRSESSTGQEVTAFIGEVDIPASTVPCGGCHGLRGQGIAEGGVYAGDLTWSFLTKPYGHANESGRNHPAFSEVSFIRSLATGLDPAGNKMVVAMPTYRLPQQDMADLIAYLKRIETDRDPGLTETSLVLGTVLPDQGPLAEMGQAMREVLQAYFDEVNSSGGIYNRKLELQVAAVAGDATSTVANTKRLIEEKQVFAITSSLTAGADEGMAALSQDTGVPLIGPSTLLPERDLPLNRYVFYLLPGLNEQARALANFAAKRMNPEKSRVAILSPDSVLNRQIGDSIEDQGKKNSWTNLSRIYYQRQRPGLAQIATELKQQGVDTVFFLGPGGDASALFQEAATANWQPSIYVLGTLAGKAITESVPVQMKDKVFLAFATVPTDVSAAGAAEYGALLKKYKLKPSAHDAARFSAFAAAKILVEALKHAGKDLSREGLMTALEGLYEFDTGLTPRITFGPNRRIGALGAYIVTIDSEKKLFPASVEWISTE